MGHLKQDFPVHRKSKFSFLHPYDDRCRHLFQDSLGLFCFGEDLLDLEKGLPLGLRHAEHVEQVAGQSDTGKYPEVVKTK